MIIVFIIKLYFGRGIGKAPILQICHFESGVLKVLFLLE